MQNVNSTEQNNADRIASEHQAHNEKTQRVSITDASKALGRLIAEHKEGKPVYAEMAARIEARLTDSL
jgi:hypothetical protein